ncbi:glycoside hydrolase family 25 protein [Myroides pelagicus]|uniref:Glycoside hydrolase family 25 protein n=1 Tax=Myroides pelagicus TaxID=270914 RepID=A0A7K1GJB9_9FLAO|nr:GH25 family lysozyme [Myroides pelagicus]MEC4112559.1 GH25 family lysozyme [Myroides pelagicus]MTH28523.1 glycoside hydrolase family 25 protein [Myroides pelagicus]
MSVSGNKQSKVKGEDVLKQLPRTTTQRTTNTRKRKTTSRSKKTKQRNSNSAIKKLTWLVAIFVFIGLGVWFGVKYKHALDYFFSDLRAKKTEKNMFDFRTAEVVARHEGKLFGIDVSHYQSAISWSKVDSVIGKAPVEFAFIRATMGKDSQDKRYVENWRGAGANHIIRGAYHYYRPDENSTEQANNFIKNVTLTEGDFPPILDIEDLPKKQSMENLKVGLKNWIAIVEAHYKVKPVLYSGEHYYNNYLHREFPDHIIWIANYNFFVEEIKDHWHFWQFTENGRIKGIKGKVDLNVYNGTKADIRKLLIK